MILMRHCENLVLMCVCVTQTPTVHTNYCISASIKMTVTLSRTSNQHAKSFHVLLEVGDKVDKDQSESTPADMMTVMYV
jgi:hypothetical protein